MLCLVLCSLISLIFPSFLCFAFGQDVDQDLVVQAYIHTPKYTIKGLDQFLYACLCIVCPFPCVSVQIHACLPRSRLLPCSCLFPLCGFVLVCLWGLLACLVAPIPLLWLVWMQPCLGVHLYDVWLTCRLPFSPLLSFSCQSFSCQPLYVPYNMLTLPLCVITCFLCAILFGFPLFVCILVYMLMHVSLYACLCHQAYFLSMILCGFTLVFEHEIPSPFQELCLMAHVLSILQYNGITDTKSKPTFILLGHPLLLDNTFVLIT